MARGSASMRRTSATRIELHAAIDWDWEVPAVTLVPLILGAAAVAVPARPSMGRRRWTPVAIGLGALALAVVPALSALAQTRIDQAMNAYDAGQCAEASSRAKEARAIQPSRPEPTASSWRCAPCGMGALPKQSNSAARPSPRTRTIGSGGTSTRWYSVAGEDPRPALRAAHLRDPLGAAPNALLRTITASKRRIWPAQTSGAYVWIHGRAHSPIASGSFLPRNSLNKG